MGIIFTLIGITVFISLYDFYSARNWQQVTSVKRNNIVFEERNQEYGAYTIRRDYDKQLIYIMLGLLLGVGAIAGAYQWLRTIPKIELKIPVSDSLIPEGAILIDISTPVIPDDPKPAKTSKQDMVENPVITPTDDPVNKKIEAQDPDKMAGNVTQKGDGTNEFKPPVDGKIDGTGTGGKVVDPPVEVPTFDPDVAAQFPGGKQKMMEFLKDRIRYPEIPQSLGIGGKCTLLFVVNKNGEISNIKVLRPVPDCPECDQEAIRVLRKMPNWKPAIQDGKPVDSYFQMPINFQVQ